MNESITVRECIRPHPTARAVPAVAEIVEGGSTDRLMSARSTILPGTKRRSTNGIGRAAQAWPGAGIEVGVPHAVARCA